MRIESNYSFNFKEDPGPPLQLVQAKIDNLLGDLENMNRSTSDPQIFEGYQSYCLIDCSNINKDLIQLKNSYPKANLDQAITDITNFHDNIRDLNAGTFGSNYDLLCQNQATIDHNFSDFVKTGKYQ